jgi:acyl dehydratase
MSTLDIGLIDHIGVAAYAAASGDTNPLHLDPLVARQLGYQRPLVHGLLTMSHLARLAAGVARPSALTALQVRFVRPLLVGSELRCEAFGHSVGERLREIELVALSGDMVIARGVAQAHESEGDADDGTR